MPRASALAPQAVSVVGSLFINRVHKVDNWCLWNVPCEAFVADRRTAPTTCYCTSCWRWPAYLFSSLAGSCSKVCLSVKVFPQPGLHVEAVFITVYIISLAATENTLILLFGPTDATIFYKSCINRCIHTCASWAEGCSPYAWTEAVFPRLGQAELSWAIVSKNSWSSCFHSPQPGAGWGLKRKSHLFQAMYHESGIKAYIDILHCLSVSECPEQLHWV